MAHVALLSVTRSQDRARAVHRHDCELCVFVGRMEFDGDRSGGADVLFCPDPNSSQGDLIIRLGDEGPDYQSFPLGVARMAARSESLPETGSSWTHAVTLYDAWDSAGRPVPDIMESGDAFFSEFTVVTRGSHSSDPEELSGTVFAVISLSPRVERRHAEYYVRSQFPATHCQHEHDCCGNSYSGHATWSYAPGTDESVILVSQSWSVNV